MYSVSSHINNNHGTLQMNCFNVIIVYHFQYETVFENCDIALIIEGCKHDRERRFKRGCWVFKQFRQIEK